MSTQRWLATTVGIVLAFGVVAAACGGDDGDSSDSPGSATATGTPATAAPSLREGMHAVRRLLTEAPRSEVSTNGLLIHLGGLDGTKFTRGGWGSGWGALNVEDEKRGFRPVVAKTARIFFYDQDASGSAITIRARSGVADQKLTLYLGRTAIRTHTVTSDWSDITFDVEEWPTERALRSLTLGFARSGKPTAEVQWIWLRTGEERGGEPPVRKTAALALGGKELKTLVAEAPRRHSYYFEIPAGADLLFDYGAEAATHFRVVVATDGEADEEIFSAEPEIGSWQEGRASLDKWAGKVVRLDLITEGPAGAAGWGDPAIMIGTPPPEPPPPLGPATYARNVIFLVIDTVRYDVFDTFNADNYVHTPAFSKLAEECTIFDRAYDNENWTKPSTLTMLTGVYPSTHNTKTDAAKAPAELEFIGEALQKHDFRTASFIANGFVSDHFGFNQGWDDYKNYIREAKPSQANFVYGDALEWLEAHKDDGRFFLYLQTIDPHVPYRKRSETIARYHPEPYTGKLGSDVDGHELGAVNKRTLTMNAADKRWSRALYDAEVTFHDEHMGKFFDAVAKLGLMEDTLIIITNDHGEEHHDHGRVGHGSTLYEEMIRAPLVVRYPKVFPAGRHVTEVVGAVDIVPTILDVLGIPRHKGLEGRSLLAALNPTPEMAPSYAFSEFLDGARAVRVGRLKYIDKRSPKQTLYDLATDPGEKRNAVETLPLSARLASIHMAEALATRPKWLRLTGGVSRRALKSGKVAIEGALKEQLEALGYLN